MHKSYAKVSSDYLIGQAASVFQLARDLRGQMIPADGSRKAPALPPAGALELAQGLSALEKARQNLLDEFQQFEADSSTWAKYLKNGDERESKGGSRPRVFLKEAPEVMAAVNRARKEVQKACEKQC